MLKSFCVYKPFWNIVTSGFFVYDHLKSIAKIFKISKKKKRLLYTIDHHITAVRGQRTHILSIAVCSPACSTAYLVSTSRKVGK
ncbi:MAG: hypothetical protein AYK19_02035 [Theionarchaea archaeon DG-70-1]|nr:MAG: hypothetical protein AYK19_02035 [Theionarchaea archaeon DG-70-1]